MKSNLSKSLLVLGILALLAAGLAACGTSTEQPDLQATSVSASPTSSGASESEAVPTVASEEATSVPDSTEPNKGGTLRFGAAADLYLVDPHKVAGEVYDLTGYAEGLTSITPSGEIVPGLAESWDISSDGTVYTFHLRDGVRFHNGETLTADDVKWSLDRVMDPATEALRFADMEVIESIEVVDDQTVRITLTGPSAAFLAVLTDTFIISSDSPQEEGTIMHPIGTGPFEFVEWIPDQHMNLKRFDDYWRPDIPYVDEIVRVPIIDEAARSAALRTGEVDLVFGFPRTEVAQAEAAEDYGVDYPSASRWWCVTFNEVDTPEPLTDVRVRQAIALALDKEEINNLYELGLGVVNNQFYAPDEFWHIDDLPDNWTEPQLEEAKALLAEAGYPDGFDVTLIAPNVFDIDRLVTIIQDQISRIGIRGNLEVSDWSSYEARLVSGEDWGISAMGFAPKQDPSLFFNAIRAGTPSASYMGGGSDDPELLALLDQAAAESDPETRKDLYRQAYLKMEEQVLVIFLVNDFEIWGVRSNVKNLHLGNMFYNQVGGGFVNVWLEGE